MHQCQLYLSTRPRPSNQAAKHHLRLPHKEDTQSLKPAGKLEKQCQLHLQMFQGHQQVHHMHHSILHQQVQHMPSSHHTHQQKHHNHTITAKSTTNTTKRASKGKADTKWAILMEAGTTTQISINTQSHWMEEQIGILHQVLDCPKL